MQHLHSTHDPILVALSVLIAILGSWTALDLLRRVQANAGAVRHWWLAGAAVATGASIWSMHFVAMLAYDLDVPVRYDINLTILSLLLAIGATAVGFTAVAVPGVSPGPIRIVSAGVAMGLGICLMHYMGMAAMRLAAASSYDAVLVASSGVIAFGASTLALMLALGDRTSSTRAAGALVLGLAIAGMHYTAMAAVSFSPMPEPLFGKVPSVPAQALAVGIAACTLLLLALALTAAMFDRRLELMASREAVALRRSEERLRAVLDQMPIGVIVAEASGKVIFSNQEAERVLGHPLGDLPDWHAYAESFSGLHTDGRSLAADEYPLARAVLRGERVDHEPVLYRRGPDAVVHLEVSAAPLRGADGQMELAIATFQDVTLRTMAEQTLRRAQRLEAMGQLTAGVAHDFNNLLMVASGNLQLLARRTSDEVLLRFARGAIEALRRGADITRRLLAFGREQPLEAVSIDVSALLLDIADNVLSRTLGGTIHVKTEAEPGLWPALADRGELQAALLNLAINARDAMPGGGLLTISARNARNEALQNAIHGKLPPGDYVALCVSDTGIGMAEGVLARAFEPFFTTKDVGRGSGLGLSQVYGFAEQSGGAVEVSSRLGEGTRVTIWLPRALGGDSERQPSPTPEGQVA
jgi:PAS domain S-box-containing protein